MGQLVRFTCQKCGACCYGDWWDVNTIGMLTKRNERQRMADYLSLDLAEFEKIYAPNGMIRVNPHCSLYDPKEKRCIVHPAKPDACVSWPNWPRFVRDKENLQKAARLCPGITLEDGDLEVGRLAPITHPSPGSE